MARGEPRSYCISIAVPKREHLPIIPHSEEEVSIFMINLSCSSPKRWIIIGLHHHRVLQKSCWSTSVFLMTFQDKSKGDLKLQSACQGQTKRTSGFLPYLAQLWHIQRRWVNPTLWFVVFKHKETLFWSQVPHHAHNSTSNKNDAILHLISWDNFSTWCKEGGKMRKQTIHQRPNTAKSN